MATSIPFSRSSENAVSDLKRLLAQAGIVVVAEDTLNHAIKFQAVFENRSFALLLYFTKKTGESSKVVLEKETDVISRLVTRVLSERPLAAGPGPLAAGMRLEQVRGVTRVGVDESGKGDYFGPLVIAGVCIIPEDEPSLIRVGVRDSKLTSDRQTALIAEKIKSQIGEKRLDIIYISPERYNDLYSRMRNLNRLLAWGHARVLENLLEKSPCTVAVCDQFGDESYIKTALMERGRAVTLIQTPRAEQDLAVAAASILARDTFLKKLAELSDTYCMSFPKGASAVIGAAREFVRRRGPSELRKVAKIHFKTTETVLGEAQV
jgi:ribonuclease HIII